MEKREGEGWRQDGERPSEQKNTRRLNAAAVCV